MARRGRPRKANAKRHPSGQLVHEPQIVKGSDWVQAQVLKYGTHYNTPLGRAYAAGLLGEESEAQDRYMGGKRFARVYNRVCGGETYRCPLDRTPRGSVGEIEASEYDAKDRDWLFGVMDTLDNGGLRPWLDQLIFRYHIDHGPTWLDRLLAVKFWNDALPAINAEGRAEAKRSGVHYVTLLPKVGVPGDLRVLKAAVQALDVVAPARKEMGIRAQHWDHAA